MARRRTSASRAERERARMALADEGDFDNEESVLVEIADELKIDPDDLTIDESHFSDFGVGHFYEISHGRTEYVVARDHDEVEALAIEIVKQDLEHEPGTFNQSFLERHIDTDRLKRDLHSDVHSSNFDWASDLSDDDFWSEAERWGMDIPEEDEEGERRAPSNSEIEELTDKVTDDQLEDPIRYLEDIYGREDAVKQAIEIAGIDEDAAARDAVQADGPGHFVSSYDGQVWDTTNFVYWRVN